MLTYVSIVGGYVPLTIQTIIQHSRRQQNDAGTPHQITPYDQPIQLQLITKRQATPLASEPLPSISALLIGLVIIFVFCMAVPFLQGAGSVISLLIIAIGPLEAWKLNKRPPLIFEGPFLAAANPQSA
jgi:hypothetical protein